ncbi:GNAT family N-acetyltransferase [Croceitalea rosinachiae]|uniref:GNAT family N-acetyltransferase n=1 Tax=Croceitalea rosinachiae TaxID=3075596 RepID=A0ABU3ABA5_9FLAO|nr:GNAT family N-acetyltransferase [Croceitalea sp. F388]MDT0607259.1 GNAT family N-acetyltransferase [Croceitalea sp. F388]
MQTAIIRKIEAKDNAQVAEIVRYVFEELDVPKTGTAYEDKELSRMYEAYNALPKAEYYVIENHEKIIGCAGIAPLSNYNGNTCELQKMYFLPEARGKGLGKKLIKVCLDQAKAYGFDSCYLETMPYMKAAQSLYKGNGFEYVDAPMGCTGHTSCPVYMLKKL